VQSAFDAEAEGCLDFAGVVHKAGEMLVRVSLTKQDKLHALQVKLLIDRLAFFVFA
jgi:hypothetical protein